MIDRRRAPCCVGCGFGFGRFQMALHILGIISLAMIARLERTDTTWQSEKTCRRNSGSLPANWIRNFKARRQS
jgi:hypothetical protein